MKNNFNRFLIAETISAIGTQVTRIALPLIAVIMLHATPLDMGLIQVTEILPILVLSIITGKIIEKISKRTVLVLANIFCALILLVIPIANYCGLLSMPILISSAFLLASIENIENISQLSYVPTLVEPDGFQAANAKISASISLSTIIGPTIFGLLIAIMKAPAVVLVDAISFLISAFVIHGNIDKTINNPENIISNSCETTGNLSGASLIIKNKKYLISL